MHDCELLILAEHHATQEGAKRSKGFLEPSTLFEQVVGEVCTLTCRATWPLVPV